MRLVLALVFYAAGFFAAAHSWLAMLGVTVAAPPVWMLWIGIAAAYFALADQTGDDR